MVDALVAVRSVTGRWRLRRPDLEPYAVKNGLLAGLKPDAHGLYSLGEKQYLQFGERWQIFQASFPDSREVLSGIPPIPRPTGRGFEHNGQRAWVHELEPPEVVAYAVVPPAWGLVRGFSDATAEQVCQDRHP